MREIHANQRRSGAGAPALILLLFVAVNAVIFVLADPSCYVIDGACFNQHDIYGYPTARTLLHYGSLVDPTRPDEPWTYRQWPPLSGMVMAAALFLNGEANSYPLVFLQLAMLLATGWMVRGVLRSQEGLANVAYAFVVLNPNSLGEAHTPANETLLTFLLAACCVLALRYAVRRKLRDAVFVGAVLALAILVRPTPQYLVPLLPVALPLLVVLAGHGRAWLKAFGAGVVSAAVCVALLVPWLLFQVNAGVGWHLAGPGAENLYLQFNLRYLTDDMPGIANSAWRPAFERRQLEQLRAENPNWEDLSELEQQRLWLANTKAYVASWPFRTSTVAIAFAWSTSRFFLSGGEGEIHTLFGIENRPEKHPLAFWGLKAFAVAYAAAARLLGIFGLWVLLTRREYPLLLLCATLITYFWATSLVSGRPRQRVAVEPQLMILAAFGWTYVRDLLRAWWPGTVARSKYS
jgi:hypothetical protein